MDSRHESYKQEVLNQLISVINAYIKDNTDNVVVDYVVQTQIKEICKSIYQYVGAEIDIDGILSKKNLLSIDVVLLPMVADPEATVVLTQSDFAKVVEKIKLILQKHENQKIMDSLLHKNIYDALEKHKPL